jgi:hypothetical protein
LTDGADERWEETIGEGCQLSERAGERAKAGERTISMDELTGVQALERKHPDVPMQPGHVLRREVESIRHGTLSWFLHVDVGSGQVIEPSCGPTRTEEEGLAHLQCLVESDPKATKWHLIMETLTRHPSESLVRWVAEREGIAAEIVGIKGKSGILHPMARRAVFVHDPAHQVVCSSTPTHASWMNQVDIWLSLLVRTLLTRGNVRSLDDVCDQILAFLASSNRTMAKPITWTSTGLSPDRGSL